MMILLSVFLILLVSFRAQYTLPTLGIRDFAPAPTAVQTTLTAGTEDSTAVTFTYDRVASSILSYLNPMADFSRIQFDVASELFESPLLLSMIDIDGAVFHFLEIIPESTSGLDWVSVDITPSDFSLAADSPVWKSGIETFRIHGGLAFVDLNCVLIGTDSNVLHFRNIQFTYSQFGLSETSVSVGSAETLVWEDQSIYVSGPITVDGGRFEMRNVSRFFFTDDIEVTNGGVLIVDETLWIVPQLFNHERSISILAASDFTLTNSSLLVYHPYQFNVVGGSTLIAGDVNNIMGHFSLSLGSDLSTDVCELERYNGFGEILIGSNAELTMKNCIETLVWHVIATPIASTLSFPSESSNYVSNPALPFSVLIEGCLGAVYGLIALGFCDVTIDGSDVRTLAMYFLDGMFTVDGIDNGESYTDTTFSFGDMSVRLTGGTVVETFNYYTQQPLIDSGTSQLTVLDSLFGEVLSFGYSKIIVRDSECDGSGGYVGSRENSEIEVYTSQIDSKVIAQDSSVIRIYDSVVNGDIFADGTVYLYRTTVNGELVESGGSIIVDDTPPVSNGGSSGLSSVLGVTGGGWFYCVFVAAFCWMMMMVF